MQCSSFKFRVQQADSWGKETVPESAGAMAKALIKVSQIGSGVKSPWLK